VAPGDPLAQEQASVAAFVEAALSTPGVAYYSDVDLKTIPAGALLLEGDPQQSRRYVLAAVKQAHHWDELTEQVRAQAKTDGERMNAHHLPGWGDVWGRRRQAVNVVGTLMRRSLPFDKADLLAILDWCSASDHLSPYNAPLTPITKTLERFAKQNSVDEELTRAFTRFAQALRASHDKDARRLGTRVEQLCPAAPDGTSEPQPPSQPPPQPSHAGHRLVLLVLKRQFGVLADEPEPPASVLDPDQFPMPDDSPLRHEHRLLSTLFSEVVGTNTYHQPELKQFPAGCQLLALEPWLTGHALLAAAERHINALTAATADYTQQALWQSRYATAGVFARLLETDFELDRDGLFDLLLYLSTSSRLREPDAQPSVEKLIRQAEKHAGESPLTEGERFVLSLIRCGAITGPLFGSQPQHVQRLTALIQDGAAFYLVPGEAWTDALNRDVTAVSAAKRTGWVDLLKHFSTATSARPSAKWVKTAGQLLGTVGGEKVCKALLGWFSLVAQGQSVRKIGHYVGDTRGASDTMHEENANSLRGMLWCVPLLPQPERLTRAVTAVALSAYKKVPGVGPRAVKVGNAAVYALSELASQDAVGQLAMLKVRVKFGTAQKEIEKAFDAAASALGLPRDQIEELGVPSYGLEEVGQRIEELGEYRSELLVTGSDAELCWFDANGKRLKSVPAKVKAGHKEELKELQQSLKDIQSMLPAQRDRIDGLFLLQKNWPIAEWRERYLDHPLVGTIACRLIWCVDGTPALFSNGSPLGIDGRIIEHGKLAEVQLWHPAGRSTAEITAWRQRLEELAITQPFKQAYREIYLLTDAERNTRTYSNRFAAHVIRQHQFNALCAARGWKNKLRLMVDDTYPPATKELPQWGLRAEYWIEGIGDDYGTDTNDAGTYLRLSTDQVRFYRSEAAENYAHAGGGGYGSQAAGPGQQNVNEPIPLEQVPELVFSEIMRDVDLFVGVASIGNDPTWQDGGPEGRYRTYWQSYSFGELSGTATTRKQVLERLVPRLKIAARCSFSDRFLVVRGDKRTYKIHLGSGNILMEPNDQYLCIVPDSRARAAEEDLYLPFEGDATLSIIISKALLLADDTKIKDPTITRQIEVK
jgi:hypothetical protein